MKPALRLIGFMCLLAGCLALASATTAFATHRLALYAEARQYMVEYQLHRRGISDPRVLAAMGKAPRECFVPPGLASLAYGDHPLPIGAGQTISQPYIVALMSEWAQLKPGDKVLEIGTGSGYQAAVLGELTDKVYTIEIREDLAREAAARLDKLGYSQVHVKCADGYLGWEEVAPFDAIIVTAAVPRVPPLLTEQLKEGGRLVIPLGHHGCPQTMVRLRKVEGRLKEEARLPVRFVPLVRPPVLEPAE
jgi:protein-L-isoaspartate(D-aspartate) O-methyltransferase